MGEVLLRTRLCLDVINMGTSARPKFSGHRLICIFASYARKGSLLDAVGTD